MRLESRLASPQRHRILGYPISSKEMARVGAKIPSRTHLTGQTT